jgi:hypothetical protein
MLKLKIRKLPIDLRQLLFLHLLVIYRKDENTEMIKYIYDDVAMRVFLPINIDKRFWRENNLEFSIK